MKAYIAAATAMRREENPVQTAAELEAVFDERSFILVDDDLFKSAFMTYRFDHTTNHTKARAILYALEYSVTDDRAGMQPGDALSVEHVLPRSPEPGQWTEFTADERRQYTYELGNLLLIDYPSGANNALGNKEWPEKKALIESWSDQTPLTIAALNYEVWNIATINERSERLADLAVQAWPA